jgi:DNA/RNA-binding domain of Phe-tRNA-synthetase-like protein
MQVVLSEKFKAAHPAGVFGVLVARGCPNRPRAAALADSRLVVETRLRERFAERPIEADPVAGAYAAYFKRRGQRYPVIHQVRTVLGGRPIQGRSALVEAMFTAELDSLVLTSGHDLAALTGGLLVDVAGPGERYVKINGKEQAMTAGDMVVRDAQGVIACVLYGPDFRTRLRDDSRDALFGAWCPAGVAPEIARRHLERLADLVRLEWPEAQVDEPRVLTSAADPDC